MRIWEEKFLSFPTATAIRADMKGVRENLSKFGVWANAFLLNLEKLHSMCVPKSTTKWGLWEKSA
jgi:hypothetical protein